MLMTVTRGLGAEYSVLSVDIGIPGISKMYEPRLKNSGLLPRKVQICEAITDTSSTETAVAYTVEKWENLKQQWEPVVDISSPEICTPYPLGWASAHLRTVWLWPGQSVPTGEEATAARGFRKGDSARFVLYSSYSNANTRRPYPTAPFAIDEEVEPGYQGLRLKH
jgi:hypothetical protein